MFENDILKAIYSKSKLKRYFNLIVGCFLISLAFNIFCVPNSFVPGGISGLSIIIENIYSIDKSLFILIVDISLLIISYFLLGKNKTVYSLMGSLLLPLFIKLTANINQYLNIDTSTYLLSALFAGLLQGFGAGLIFKSGFSSGGTDIINQIISKYFKMSIGSAMYLTDGLIILISGFVFGINKIMYALIILYIISYMTDRVILGISSSKAFYIVTKEDKLISEYIIKTLNHSVTILNAKGAYNAKNSKVLMCVLPTKEYYKLKEGINSIDPSSFFVVCDSYEVVGGA